MLGDMLNRRHGKVGVWNGIIAAAVALLVGIGVCVANRWF